MIRLFDYISNWFLCLFLIWYFTKNDYLNPYYGIYFIFYGYLIYIFINYFILNVKFDICYLLFGIIVHYLPIYLFTKDNHKLNNYSLIFFITICFLYLVYLSRSLNKNFINIYFRDKQILNLNDFISKVIK